jgi:hypothetical protein
VVGFSWLLKCRVFLDQHFKEDRIPRLSYCLGEKVDEKLIRNEEKKLGYNNKIDENELHNMEGYKDKLTTFQYAVDNDRNTFQW